MTAREKSLWMRAAALLLLIYSTLYLVRAPIDFLRERELLQSAVAAVFVLAATWMGRAIWRRRPQARELGVLALFAAAYLVCLWFLERPEERLHLLEYGLFGGLVYAALSERAGPRAVPPGPAGRRAALLAIGICGLCGWLDEGIQHLLPNRYYDLRDVRLNLLAGALAVGAMYFAASARRAQRST